MSGIKGLKSSLDKLAPSVNNDWKLHTRAYKRITGPESEQIEETGGYLKVICNIDGVTASEQELEPLAINLRKEKPGRFFNPRDLKRD